MAATYGALASQSGRVGTCGLVAVIHRDMLSCDKDAVAGKLHFERLLREIEIMSLLDVVAGKILAG